MRSIAKHWPPLAALAVLYLALAACLLVSLRRNDGHLIYVLDDPYIHMAVAKNLSQHGVAGVTRYGYSSSTSSIGWPFLLALTYLAWGTGAAAPLVWNVLFATGVLCVAYILFRKRGMPPGLNFVFLLILAFCTPLPAIVFTGLEHTLHVLLAVAFLYLAGRSLSQQPSGKANSEGRRAKSEGRRVKGRLAPRPSPLASRPSARVRTFGPDAPEKEGSPLGLRAVYYALPGLITLARYEGALMVAVVCLLLVIRRRVREAFGLGVLGAVPVVVNGLVAVWKGWHFLPNPVLLKGRVPSGASWAEMLPWFRSTAVTMVQQPHVPSLLAAALLVLVLLYRKDRRFWNPAKARISIFLATAILHVALAKIGWFFRYEAYLMACGLLAIITATYEHLREDFRVAAAWKRIAVCFSGGILALPLALHGGRSLMLIPPATSLIYQQQYQMAAFLNRYYTGQGVAANDIGAINFYADIRNLDLWGLASMEVADARRKDRYGPQTIRSISAEHDVKLAMVFDDWFDRHYGGLPPEWQKVGEWEITALADHPNLVVSFYAVEPEEREPLARHLREFSSQLPDRVAQRGLYLQAQRPSPRTATRPGGVIARRGRRG